MEKKACITKPWASELTFISKFDGTNVSSMKDSVLPSLVQYNVSEVKQFRPDIC